MGYLGEATLKILLQKIKSTFATQTSLADKQDKLIAGDNITIAEDGKTISAKAGTTINELNDVGDVTITSATQGQVLKYDATNKKWVNDSSVSVTDTYSATSASAMSGKAVASAISNIALNDISDVTVSSPTADQVIKYDATNSKWINADAPKTVTVSDTYSDTSTDAMSGKAVASAVAGVKMNVATLADGNAIQKDSDGAIYVDPSQGIEFEVSATTPKDSDITLWVDTSEDYGDGDIAVTDYNEYSTNEKIIGEWINGKPIYRVVGELPSTAETVLLSGDNDGTPIGTVISFMGNAAPNNYVICDGSTYNIEDYPQFAYFLNTQFGKYDYFGGDGETTFAVPDLRGEFLRGTGTNSHSYGGNGASVGGHQEPTTSPWVFTDSYNISASGNYGSPDWVGVYNSSDVYKYAGGTSYNGPRYRYTSRPTNTSVLYCIKIDNLNIYEYTKTSDAENSFDTSMLSYNTTDVINDEDVDDVINSL